MQYIKGTFIIYIPGNDKGSRLFIIKDAIFSIISKRFQYSIVSIVRLGYIYFWGEKKICISKFFLFVYTMNLFQHI